jgi:hypothetical protein
MNASERLLEAAADFRRIEMRLRSLRPEVAPDDLEPVLASVDEALPSLGGAELGRALVFKAHVLWWQHFLRLTRGAHASDEPPDPGVRAGIACAVEGRALLRRHPDGTAADRRFADEVVRRLQATA